MTSLETAKRIALALDSKKGMDIKILRIEDLTVLADYFVIATGNSNTQVKALANETEYQLEQAGVKALRREGYDSGGWVLLDFNTVIVHIFQSSTRDFYALERLWADAVPVSTDFLNEETETKE